MHLVHVSLPLIAMYCTYPLQICMRQQSDSSLQTLESKGRGGEGIVILVPLRGLVFPKSYVLNYSNIIKLLGFDLF